MDEDSRVTDLFIENAHKAVEEWDGVDNTDLLKLLAEKFGITFRDLVMDALFVVQVEDRTPANET